MNDVTATDCQELWEAGNKHYPALADIYEGIDGSFGSVADGESRFSRKTYQVNEEPQPTLGGDGTSQTDANGDCVAPGTQYPYFPGCTLGDGGSGPVYPKFAQLREELRVILSETVTNLRDTGTTLNTAAWAYTETDGLSADDLRRKIDILEGHRDSEGKVIEGTEQPEYFEDPP